MHSNSDPRTVPLGGDSRDGLKYDIGTYDRKWQPDKGKEHIPDSTILDRVDELKNGKIYDAFDDMGDHDNRNPSYPFELQTVEGCDTRNQICHYASAIFQLQFRFFFFTILHLKTHARIIRWERAGAVVTELFDVASTPYLADFIWRYSHMNRAQRGFDDTVWLAGDTLLPNEDKRIREVLIAEEEEKRPETKGKHLNSKLYFLSMAPHRLPSDTSPKDVANYPRNEGERPGRVFFSADAGTEPRETNEHDASSSEWKKHSGDIFHILSPLFVFDHSPFSKGTRSFVAYERFTRKLFHLKDTHRIPISGYMPEHEILEELRKEKVKRIPTVVRAWDVAPYEECYDTVFGAMFAQFNRGVLESQDARVVRRAQRILRPYRLLTREIAHDVTAFKDWRQVSVVIYDALGGASVM